MDRVLVLDANQRSALAVVRSLGRHGVPLLTADAVPRALAGCSRYSQRYCPLPTPARDPARFTAAVAELCRQQDIGIVLPMIELTATLLLEHRERLPDIRIPLPELPVLDRLADKCSLMRLAESLQIPIPRTWYADDPDRLPCRLEDLPYPLVLKPGKSWLEVQGEWRRNAVRFAADAAQAREILASDPAFRAHPFLLQACVGGQGRGLFALYEHGRPLAYFAHRRLREKPPRGGVSVYSESTALDPELLAHARSLLEATGWHGIAMVEFKVAADGTPYLMEVNTRFWGSLQLAVDAGVDFPWLLYELACARHPPRTEGYRTGIRLRWLLGDVDNLYLTLRDARFSVADKLLAVLAFLRPAWFRNRHEVNRWGDLRPFWCELRQYVRDLRH